MRAGLDDRHAGSDRRLDERDERRLPLGLEQLAHVVELSDVIAVQSEAVDLDVERADTRSDAPAHTVDHRAEADTRRSRLAPSSSTSQSPEVVDGHRPVRVITRERTGACETTTG